MLVISVYIVDGVPEICDMSYKIKLPTKIHVASKR